MSIAQRLYEGVDTPTAVGLITYMRTDSTAMAGVAMGEARDVIRDRFGEPYTMPKGRVYKTKTKGAQEAHESIRPTSFQRDPDSLAGVLKPEELRLYRLIWQRAIASQMAAKELETTTIELAAGAYELRASATRTLFDGFARVYTEGRDDGAEDEEERSLPALAEGDATTVEDVTPTQHFTEPPPRYTEATLIKALEEHGIGRPSTYAATISTIVDRGYVRVEERRLRPGVRRRASSRTCSSSTSATTSTSSSPRGWRRSSTRSPAASATGCRCSASSTSRSATASTRSAARRRAAPTSRPRRPTRSAREGHPMVIRLGRNGRFLACSLYPEHKESRPLPGEEAAAAGRARARPAPSAARATLVGSAAGSGRSSAARATPTATTSRRRARRRPSRSRSRSSAPSTATATSPPRRARRTGNVFWGCSRYPKCDFTTNLEPVGALHDADDGPVAKKGEAAHLPEVRRAIDPLPEDGDLVGARLAGGPPNPEALARPARGGGRGRRWHGPRRDGQAAGRRLARRAATPQPESAPDA